MIIVDTSVWIEFFKQSNVNISDLLAGYIEDGEVVALSPVFGELLQGVRNESEEKLILEFWRTLPKLNETELWIEAGKFSNKKKLISKGIGLIDSFILISAKINKLSVWTLDKGLQREFQAL